MKANYLLPAIAAMLMLSGVAMAQDDEVNWGSLTEEQQQVLGPYAENFDTLPAERRVRLAEGARRYAEIPPACRAGQIRDTVAGNRHLHRRSTVRRHGASSVCSGHGTSSVSAREVVRQNTPQRIVLWEHISEGRFRGRLRRGVAG